MSTVRPALSVIVLVSEVAESDGTFALLFPQPANMQAVRVMIRISVIAFSLPHSSLSLLLSLCYKPLKQWRILFYRLANAFYILESPLPQISHTTVLNSRAFSANQILALKRVNISSTGAHKRYSLHCVRSIPSFFPASGITANFLLFLRSKKENACFRTAIK
jgi:hypothetical protein